MGESAALRSPSARDLLALGAPSSRPGAGVGTGVGTVGSGAAWLPPASAAAAAAFGFSCLVGAEFIKYGLPYSVDLGLLRVWHERRHQVAVSDRLSAY
jgi:hypothetical protein